ncbi:MAG: ABC transporter substrate-binding protein [Pseudomonadota bacterium]
MKHFVLAGASALALVAALSTTAHAADCPAITVADDQGITGEFPQQFELAEFQEKAGCTLTFQENPEIGALNGEIQGNPELPPLAERLPAEPLVVAPYDMIGTYGGTLDALSNATEAGTSDFLSIRHVNFVRFADDLQTIVPNIAKGWEWNENFTQLTFFLREGHKWSDGAPFTAHDVKFWYDDLNFDTNVIEKPKDFLLAGGERMEVVVVDDQTVRFEMAAPKPGFLAHFANSYSQGFQPKHFLGLFHPKHNADADAEAAKYGFANGYEAVNFYFGQSDWTDTPTPMLRDLEKSKTLPKATQPTLESHIYIADTTEGRKLVANPYFHQVDTAGNQLPYISRQDELYINENEVRILKLVNAEVDYKSQSVQLPSAPILLENQEKGDYTVALRPTIAMVVIGLNVTHEDEAKRAVFSNLEFRRAMSVAINRDELNEAVYFGLGTPQQYIGFSPKPGFVDDKWLSYATEFDPEGANATLDSLGMADTDGDGFRELPNGEQLVINMQFATQGGPAELYEFVAQNWKDVGINTVIKEVTPDEYRSAQSANKLDVASWGKGQPVAIVLGNNELWVPPYENYFGSRNGVLWDKWLQTDGAEGVEPPQWAKDMIDDVEAFQQAAPGSAESAEIGARMAATMAEQLLWIGMVSAPNPIYHRNALKNVTDFKTWSYEYYRTYPYRGTQWFLADEG